MRWAKDSWTSKCLEYDKWAHFAGSCAITLAIYMLLKSVSPFVWVMDAVFAGGITLILGIALELWQSAHPDGEDGFSWRDLAANVLGIALAMGVVIL